MTIVEVVEAIRRFSEEEKAALAYALYHSNTLPLAPLSREQALAEIATFKPTSKAKEG